MWSFSHRRLIAKLASSFRCISIDLLGMGFSSKPHQSRSNTFGYTYLEQSRVVETVISKLGLKDITFLSFDHGGPVGFSLMTRRPELFSRIVIANSWAWSCHNFRATKIWSTLAPLSRTVLKRLMLDKKRWLFEMPSDLRDEDVWNACTRPYPHSIDFKPMAVMASQLTRAKPFFSDVQAKLPRLAEKKIEIIWSTKGGGLFPEFVREDQFLALWRECFPDARVKLLNDVGYYELIVRPPSELIDLLINGAVLR